MRSGWGGIVIIVIVVAMMMMGMSVDGGDRQEG